MAELKFQPLPSMYLRPPNKNASPWISTIENPVSVFGNTGPNVSKLRKRNKNAMHFHVRLIALEQIKICCLFHIY